MMGLENYKMKFTMCVCWFPKLYWFTKCILEKNKENEIDSKASTSTFSKEVSKHLKSFWIDSESVLCKITKSNQMKFYDAKQIIAFCIHWIKSRNAHNFASRNIYVALHYIISFYRVTKFVFSKSLFSY